MKFHEIINQCNHTQFTANTKIREMSLNALIISQYNEIDKQETLEKLLEIVHSQQDWLFENIAMSYEESNQIIDDFVEKYKKN